MEGALVGADTIDVAEGNLLRPQTNQGRFGFPLTRQIFGPDDPITRLTGLGRFVKRIMTL